MEEATGSQLGTVWDEMTPDLKLKIMRDVVSIETKMLSISFSQYVVVLFAYSKFGRVLIRPSAMGAYILRMTQWMGLSLRKLSAMLQPN